MAGMLEVAQKGLLKIHAALVAEAGGSAATATATDPSDAPGQAKSMSAALAASGITEANVLRMLIRCCSEHYSQQAAAAAGGQGVRECGVPGDVHGLG